MSWTESKEIKLRKMLIHSYLHSWIHTQSSDHYEKIDFRLTVFLSVLTIGMGTTVFSTLQGLIQCSQNYVILTVFSLINIIIGVFLAIQQYVNYPSKIYQHSNMSIDWLLLGTKIDYCLSLPREQRISTLIQYDQINDIHENLIRRKIEIPDGILADFEKEFLIDYLKMNLHPNIDQVVDIKIDPSNDIKDIEHPNGLRLQKEFEERLKKKQITPSTHTPTIVSPIQMLQRAETETKDCV